VWTLILVLGLANLALVAVIFSFYRLLRRQAQMLGELHEEMHHLEETLAEHSPEEANGPEADPV